MKHLISTVALSLAVCGASYATQPPPGFSGAGLIIQIDESGNAPLVNGAPVMGIPDKNGLLVYGLPANAPVTAGDVLVYDPGTTDLSDILRFLPNCNDGTSTQFQWLSDLSVPPDDAGDLGIGTMKDLQANQAHIWEPVNTGAGENMIYNAGENSYYLQSDGPYGTSTVPEPSGLALLGVGGLPLLGYFRRKLRLV